MRLKNLPNHHRGILSQKHADGCEKWARNTKLHSTVVTYTEAYWKGASHALSLPPMLLGMVIHETATIRKNALDSSHAERAWKAFCYGEAKDAEEALELTKKEDIVEPADPDEEEA